MKNKDRNFEEKMKELETIINELETGNVSLEDAIDKYTKAMKLVKDCDAQLKTVEEKISKIVAENGTLKDFNAEDNN